VSSAAYSLDQTHTSEGGRCSFFASRVYGFYHEYLTRILSQLISEEYLQSSTNLDRAVTDSKDQLITAAGDDKSLLARVEHDKWEAKVNRTKESLMYRLLYLD
jgi:hypothetical protein